MEERDTLLQTFQKRSRMLDITYIHQSWRCGIDPLLHRTSERVTESMGWQVSVRAMESGYTDTDFSAGWDRRSIGGASFSITFKAFMVPVTENKLTKHSPDPESGTDS